MSLISGAFQPEEDSNIGIDVKVSSGLRLCYADELTGRTHEMGSWSPSRMEKK
jgi:hypothetical protein